MKIRFADRADDHPIAHRRRPASRISRGLGRGPGSRRRGRASPGGPAGRRLCRGLDRADKAEVRQLSFAAFDESSTQTDAAKKIGPVASGSSKTQSGQAPSNSSAVQTGRALSGASAARSGRALSACRRLSPARLSPARLSPARLSPATLSPVGLSPACRLRITRPWVTTGLAPRPRGVVRDPGALRAGLGRARPRWSAQAGSKRREGEIPTGDPRRRLDPRTDEQRSPV